MRLCKDAVLVDETTENSDGAPTSEPERKGSNRYAWFDVFATDNSRIPQRAWIFNNRAFY